MGVPTVDLTRSVRSTISCRSPYYSLTLHDPQGDRVLGFDNAHPVREGSGPGARTRIEYDHRHQRESVRFYDYQDAGTLIMDFWTEVESIINGKG